MTHDPDCDEVELRWESEGTRLAEGRSATVTFPPGIHDLEAVASDRFDEVREPLRVVVLDVTAPRINIAFETPELWPPRHDLVELRLGRELRVEVIDNCDPEPTLRVIDVRPSEAPDARGSGGPRHAADAEWSEDRVLLRRERSGRGTGRSYTITVEGRDRWGNAATAALEVLVPHDQRARQ